MKRKLTFEQWIERVNAWCLCHIGLGYDDLPDCPYRDWYEDGVSPGVAGCRARRMAEGF